MTHDILMHSDYAVGGGLCYSRNSGISELEACPPSQLPSLAMVMQPHCVESSGRKYTKLGELVIVRSPQPFRAHFTD